MHTNKATKRPDHMRFNGRILFLTDDTALIRRNSKPLRVKQKRLKTN